MTALSSLEIAVSPSSVSDNVCIAETTRRLRGHQPGKSHQDVVRRHLRQDHHLASTGKSLNNALCDQLGHFSSDSALLAFGQSDFSTMADRVQVDIVRL